MPLWTYTDSGWQKQARARTDHPATAFLCAPGPSLADATADLRGPARVVYAINSAYPRIRPDVWIGLESLIAHSPSVWFESFPKITRMLQGDTDRVRHHPNTFYADLETADASEILLRRDQDAKFVWVKNTLIFALHFIIWSGHKKIHFVGCNLGGSRDYYDGRTLSDERRKLHAELHSQQAKTLARLAPLCLRNGIELISSTADSKLNAFLRFQPLDEALTACDAIAPKPEAVHVPDDQWRDLVRGDTGYPGVK